MLRQRFSFGNLERKRNNFVDQSSEKNSQTRMHSSRMRTARLLPASPSMHCSGGCTWSQGMYLPNLVRGGTWSTGCTCLGGTWSTGCTCLGECTWSRGYTWSQGGVPGPRGCTCLGGVPAQGVVPGLGGVPGPGERGVPAQVLPPSL